MRTNNAMQLKAVIGKRAKKAQVSPQLMLQNYMLERLIDRLSRSKWKDNVIIKGGVLIGSLIGVNRRSTKDLDATVYNLPLSHDVAERIFKDICAVEIADDISFEFLRTENIQESEEYPGIRIFLRANYDPMSVPVKVDITTGDRIVPSAIEYEYPFVFDEGSVCVMAYPLETVLAEKIETIISRNVGNTRIRDFYDVYELWRLRRDKCKISTLREAVEATSAKRGSDGAIRDYRQALQAIRASDSLARRWGDYVSANAYAEGIAFLEACDAVEEVMQAIEQGDRG